MGNRLGIYLVILLWGLAGCGGYSDEEETDNIVTSANIMLSESLCQQAIDLLESYGQKRDHADYIMVYAAAYACRAGYSEPNFYGNDLPNIGTSASSLLGSLVRFSTSSMSSPDDQNYQDLLTGFQFILNAYNASEPSAAAREAQFSTGKGNDMNVQALYMSLALMGKYAFYYGNADPTNGVKGAGTILNGNSNGNSNECFTTYGNDTAETIITAGVTGSCNLINEGHPQLSEGVVSQELRVRRLCQGVILFNNFVDLLTNVTISDDLGDLQTLQTALATTVSAVCTAQPNMDPLVCTVTAQSQCETLFATDPGDTVDTGSNSLEIYFAAIYETLFN